MSDKTPPPGGTRHIDLTKETEVNFWCRVFDITVDQLRDAVHHSGHQVEDVERYLRHRKEGKSA